MADNLRIGDNAEPRAEDIFFNVNNDKDSKKTADGEFSPHVTDDEAGGANGFKPGEIAAKALDLPISTSHSP